MMSHHQYFLHRERWHVNLLVGHVGYRWTTSWRILLRRSHSIRHRTRCCRAGQQTVQDLHLPLFSVPQTMPKMSMASSSLLLQIGYASGFAGHRFTLPIPNMTTGSESKLPHLHFVHPAQLLPAHQERRGTKIPLLPSTFRQHWCGNISCRLYILLVVLLCATNWSNVPHSSRCFCSWWQTCSWRMHKSRNFCADRRIPRVEQNFHGQKSY